MFWHAYRGQLGVFWLGLGRMGLQVTGEHGFRGRPRGKVWAVAGIAAGCALVWGIVGTPGVLSTPEAAAPAPHKSDQSVTVAAKNVTPAPPRPVSFTELRRGVTLQSALANLGLHSGEIADLTREVGTRVDLRRLPAGTGLSAVPAETPTEIGVRVASDHFWTFRLDETGWNSDRVDLPVVTSVETTGGVIESSVSQALSDAVEARTLVHAYADIFQWDVDLLVDPRPGDRVRVVYEVKRFGRLPEGLPPFRGAQGSEGEVLGLGRVLAADYEGSRASSVAFWVEHAGDTDGASDDASDGAYYDADGQPLRKAFLKSPLNYRRISSGFSRARRHPVTGKVRPHYGVDFAAPRGTPVASTANGVVIAAGTMGGLGRAVKIRHTSGYTTSYGHFSRIAKGIRKGARVEQSQIVGYVGSSGLANGPHLHYTLYENGRPIDPLRFKNRPAAPLADTDLPQLKSASRRWIPVLASIEVQSNVQLAQARIGAGEI